MGEFWAPGAEIWLFKKKNMDRSIDLAVWHIRWNWTLQFLIERDQLAYSYSLLISKENKEHTCSHDHVPSCIPAPGSFEIFPTPVIFLFVWLFFFPCGYFSNHSFITDTSGRGGPIKIYDASSIIFLSDWLIQAYMRKFVEDGRNWNILFF